MRTPVDIPGADDLRCVEVDKNATNSLAPILGRARSGTAALTAAARRLAFDVTVICEPGGT